MANVPQPGPCGWRILANQEQPSALGKEDTPGSQRTGMGGAVVTQELPCRPDSGLSALKPKQLQPGGSGRLGRGAPRAPAETCRQLLIFLPSQISFLPGPEAQFPQQPPFPASSGVCTLLPASLLLTWPSCLGPGSPALACSPLSSSREGGEGIPEQTGPGLLLSSSARCGGWGAGRTVCSRPGSAASLRPLSPLGTSSRLRVFCKTPRR